MKLAVVVPLLSVGRLADPAKPSTGAEPLSHSRDFCGSVRQTTAMGRFRHCRVTIPRFAVDRGRDVTGLSQREEIERSLFCLTPLTGGSSIIWRPSVAPFMDERCGDALRSHGTELFTVETPVSELDNTVVKSIKDTLSIVDVVSDYISLQRRGRVYVGLCPFHDDHRPSLDVDPERARYRCWACGAVGDIFSWVMAMEKLTFPEALERLAERAGIPLSRARRSSRRDELAGLREVVRWALDQYVSAFWQPSLGQKAREYMESRGFSSDVLRKFNIGYAPEGWTWLAERAELAGIDLKLLARVGLVRERRSGGYYDWFRNRVIFPIFDAQGRPVAFGGRVLPGASAEDAKYINSPETPLFSKASTLYALHIARHEPLRDQVDQKRRLIVVEGYTDCMALHQAGVRCAVATLGTALTERHLTSLRRYVDGVVLVFDADEAGARAADRALELFLRTRFDVRVCVLPVGTDPADFVRDEGVGAFLELVKAAVGPLEFRLERARRMFALSTVTGKQEALDYVLRPLVASRQEGTVSGGLTPDESLLVDRVAEELHVSYNTVLGRLQQLVRETTRESRVSNRSRDPVGNRSRPASDQPDHLERELLALLLVWPESAEFLEESDVTTVIETPWIRQAIVSCLENVRTGVPISVEAVALELGGDLDVFQQLHELVELGQELLAKRSREAWLHDLMRRMEERRLDREARRVQEAMEKAAGDPELQKALLQRLFELRRTRQRLAGRAVERVHGEEEAR